ncbi:DUF3782 domain-containing protein [Thermodesulforhabdus norvegica]|uniref:DUF8196 domain-containing protein n=1 Tax=Thermodesulforhabdus norvegica TaxID=39841 RepID=A0A1I4TZW2_9BACT|nr:DUF3782 domain-containing protein [Thermodesulforhabdus norvegica]SFM82120.1 hypothetical protein SAMN05660836_01611 [Thermodesulforhabdus norvegica]
MEEVAERVSRLEEVLEEFIRTVGIEFSKLYNSQMRTEAELRAFKEEMRAFKEEMRAFKEEMKAFKDEMNKRMGELARRLGTVVEDVVAPGIPYAIRRAFGLEVVELSLRRRKRVRGREREYDVIAVAGDYVFVIDVKSRYRREYLGEFEEMLLDFFEYFPEYKGLKVVPVIASFNFTEEIINLATRKRWLVVQLGGEYLEFVNKDQVGLP